MGFLDYLFGKKREDKPASSPKQNRSEMPPNPSPIEQAPSVKAISQGAPFCLKNTKIQVLKQYYNQRNETITVSDCVTATIERVSYGGDVRVVFNNLNELKSKGVIQTNLRMTPQFVYNGDSEGNEFASAEINNSLLAMASGKEYISMFQISQQKGEIVSFLINNLPGDQDFYFLIIMR